MITKKKADRCVTHHHACDCREYRYQEMESALKAIGTWARFEINKAVCDGVFPDSMWDELTQARGLLKDIANLSSKALDRDDLIIK